MREKGQAGWSNGRGEMSSLPSPAPVPYACRILTPDLDGAREALALTSNLEALSLTRQLPLPTTMTSRPQPPAVQGVWGDRGRVLTRGSSKSTGLDRGSQTNAHTRAHKARAAKNPLLKPGTGQRDGRQHPFTTVPCF